MNELLPPLADNGELLDLLKAQINTTGGQGLAAPQDAGAFIDLSVEQTAVLRQVRVETGIRNGFYLDTLALGEPVITAGVEGQAPAEADVVAPARTRKTLQPQEIVAAFDVSFSFLYRNVAREAVNESLNRLFAKRFGKDIVLAVFSGDTSLAGSTRTDKARKILNGFVRQAESDAAVHDYAIAAGAEYVETVFPAMVALLPKDYRDARDELAFYVSAAVYDRYAQEIGSRPTALGDQVLAGPWGTGLRYNGITLVPVFGLADNRILLTLKQNLVVGFGRQITLGRDLDHRARLLRVTLTAEVDAKYVDGDLIVLGAGA